MANFPGDPPIKSGNKTGEDHADWLCNLTDAVEDAQQAIAEAFAGQDGILQHGSGQAGLTVEATSPVSMSVLYDPGVALYDGLPFWVRLQGTLTFTAPTSNPRIDLIQVNFADREVSVVEGTEDASPSAPSASADSVGIYQVYHRVGESSIKDTDDSSNGYLTDVRTVLSILNNFDKSSTPDDRNMLLYNTSDGKWKPSGEHDLWGNFIAETWGGDDGVIDDALNEFLVTAQGTPDMTVHIDTGMGIVDRRPVALTAAEDSETITAPASNPRIDLVQISKAGLVTVKTGTEAASPVAPSPDTNNIELAEISLTVGQTSIQSGDIDASVRTLLSTQGTVRKKAIILTAAGGTPATSGGCADATFDSNDDWILAFDPDTDESAVWMLALPDDYDGGTFNATFFFKVASDWAASSDKVRWLVQGVALDAGDAMNTALGTALAANAVWASGEAADDLIKVSASGLTLAGSPAADDWAKLKVTRDADDATNDTCTADADLLGVMLEYTPR